MNDPTPVQAALIPPHAGSSSDHRRHNADGQTRAEFTDLFRRNHDDGLVQVDVDRWLFWDDAVDEVGEPEATRLRDDMQRWLNEEGRASLSRVETRPPHLWLEGATADEMEAYLAKVDDPGVVVIDGVWVGTNDPAIAGRAPDRRPSVDDVASLRARLVHARDPDTAARRLKRMTLWPPDAAANVIVEGLAHQGAFDHGSQKGADHGS